MLNKLAASAVVKRLYAFIFKPQSAVKVGVFRIAFGLIAICSELLNLSHLTQYYTTDGYFSNQLVSHLNGLAHGSLLNYISSPQLVIGLYWLLIIATACFTLGLYSRLAAVMIFVLLQSFDQRNVLLLYGGDRVLLIVFFFCMFLQSDAALSLRNYLGKRKPPKYVYGAAVRLIQIQVAFMYFFTAVLKVASPQWRDGTFLYSLLNNPNFALFHLPWLKHFPLPLAIATLLVLCLELSYIFLVWWRRLNPYIITAMAMEHTGILLLMNATYFSEIMLTVLILCLDDYYFSKAVTWLGSKGRLALAWKPSLGRPQ